jgi:hypothetical protein
MFDQAEQWRLAEMAEEVVYNMISRLGVVIEHCL